MILLPILTRLYQKLELDEGLIVKNMDICEQYKIENDLNERTVNLFRLSEPLSLECGQELPQVKIAYETYGRLNADASNAILVCHALTGSAHVAGPADFPSCLFEQAPLLAAVNGNVPGWWDGVIGPGKLFDTSKYFIISTNILGSCYGSIGPNSINPATGFKYNLDFPQVTVRDMVAAQYALVKYLGIEKLAMVTGGSLGGMQALEWAIKFPDTVCSIVPIATSAQHSDWGIGLNHLARQAILNDPEWNNGNYIKQPLKGLSLARKVGMISYRTDESFNARFKYERVDQKDNVFNPDNIFQVESYLNYQGKKLVERFDANSYLYLTRAMDTHDVSRNRGALKDVLGSVKAQTLCIGIDSDLLYPAHEQRATSDQISQSEYAEIKSKNGHDAFLIEFDQLTKIVRPFLESV